MCSVVGQAGGYRGGGHIPDTGQYSGQNYIFASREPAKRKFLSKSMSTIMPKSQLSVTKIFCLPVA